MATQFSRLKAMLGKISLILTISLVAGCSVGLPLQKPGIAFKAPGACAEFVVNSGEQKYTKHTVQTYNEKGLLVEIRTVDVTTDAIISQDKFVYNDKGLLTLMTSANPAGQIYKWIHYRYDSSGRKIREGYSEGTEDQLIFYSQFGYDSTGQLTVKETLRADAENYSNAEFYFYDDKGRKVLEELDDDGDSLTDRLYKYRYDEEGRLVQIINARGDDGTVFSTYNYSYDPLKNEQTILHFDADGKFISEKIDTKDEFGNLYLSVQKVGPGKKARIIFYDYSCYR